jgi:hypothetical protein
MSSDVRPIGLPARNKPLARVSVMVATNRRKREAARSSRVQFGSHNLRIVFRALERLPAPPVEAVSPEMEPTMSIRNILMTTAALAMLTPLIIPTTSFAAGRGIAGNVAAGVAASPQGVAHAAAGGGAPVGGMHVGGGGGWNHGGGVAMGNRGGWNQGGGVAMGNGGGGWNRGGVAIGGGNWNHGGGGWHGHHHGGFFPGAVAGAVIGGALASNAYYGGPYYNNNDYGYYDQPDYYDDSAVVAAPVGDDAAGYCAQRFRSYDPGSGTYLGYDGLRHPCP